MPSDYSSIVTAVTSFADTYVIFAVAGLVVGLGLWAARKLARLGR